MSKHTPNPWTKVVHNWSQISVCTKDRTVCRLDITDEATEETENDLVIENEANASLIAAAPQMLEALELLSEAVRSLDEQISTVHDKIIITDAVSLLRLQNDALSAVKQAEAAIAAAKGEV